MVKISHLMIFNLVLLVLPSDMVMAVRMMNYGPLDAPICKKITFEVHCDDVKPCVQLCATQDPLYPIPSKIASIVCHNSSECGHPVAAKPQ
uniref:Bifunctional inhibitor/plant lipid transfer protein/seed storage helical domain-containing protein n=1 Tax=Oryza punctata TaxID=4537 RepID=A0A0E0MGA1_ORYPU